MELPEVDGATPPDAGAGFPIVGIGASAGGLAAFEAFFSGMPDAGVPGTAWVLVQHLDRQRPSLLASLVQRFTAQQVFEITDGMQVQPNCVYVIPPNRQLSLQGGVLHLVELAPGFSLPIDAFFRSLAEDLKERSIGLVLSGTGSDGALGARAIKAAGGLVMVQKPGSAEFDGMPRAVLATGLVDFELTPAEMPAQLSAWLRRPQGSSGAAGQLARENAEALASVFVLLRGQTGHDFAAYKPGMVNRRIERRMAFHQLASLEQYVKHLQQSPAEVELLFQDLLVGVTSFFRDPEAFHALETEAIPRLFSRRAPGDPIRVWVPACSTGEEAYSIAMLLQEQMESLHQSHTVQLFATDMDGRAIAAARAGRFPAGIAADLSEARLARFFVPEPGGAGYRIDKSVREMVVFSEHDVARDPPFSRLDLISCRNLFIYLRAELQQHLLALFQQALKPDGVLFLGSSEGLGDPAGFEALNPAAKLYRRLADSLRRPGGSSNWLRPRESAIDASLPRARGAAPKPALTELAQRALLDTFAPASALVDERGDILYVHGGTGRFLELPAGVAGTHNILAMAREGLRSSLASALLQVARTGELARALVSVKNDGGLIQAQLEVRPVERSPERLYVVSLVEMQEAPALVEPLVPGSAPEPGVTALQQVLRDREAQLQHVQRALEASGHEQASSFEEMQSVNEELQSTNEELETSKEELQSLNEELTSVNAELQASVSELQRLNGDMSNLLAGSRIATLFVDLELCILRFTPSAQELISLLPGDVGRPLAHLTSKLVGHDTLVDEVKAVIDTLVPTEVEVQSLAGDWFLMRIRPYRTLKNVIEGAVIVFLDINELARTRAALKGANETARLAVVVRDSSDAITVQDLEGRTLAWNPAAERLYGWTEAEALQLKVHDRTPPGLQAEELAKVLRLGRAEVLMPWSTQRLTRQGAVVEVTLLATALLDEAGRMYAVATTERRVEPALARGAV